MPRPHRQNGMNEPSRPKPRYLQALLVLSVSLSVLASACSSSADSSQPGASEVPDAAGDSAPPEEAIEDLPVAILPVATFAGEPCGEADVCSSREVELFGRTYVGSETIGRRRLGNLIATPIGNEVAGFEIREVTGIDPELVFVVVDDLGGRTVYEQKRGVAVDGPLLVRTNAPGLNNDGTLEGGLTEITNSAGCMTVWDGEVMVWPHGTTWNPSEERIVFSDGTSAVAGDRVVVGGHSSSAGQVADQFGPEVADLLESCAATMVYFANNELPTVQ